MKNRPTVALLAFIMTTSLCHSDVIYRPGALEIQVASGMEILDGKPWAFTALDYDPYTQPIQFPAPVQASELKAISIELEKDKPADGDRLELFFILDNNKGVTVSQRLDVRLEKGSRRYVFETKGIRWFKGRLTGIRIDPGTAPGVVSIKSIGLFKALPPSAKEDVFLAVPTDLKPSLGPVADTLTDSPLIRYRLFSDNIDYAILDVHQGQSKVLQLHLRNSGETPRVDTLDLAASKRLMPFSPIIPPYVGLNAEKFSIRVWVKSPADLAGKNIKIERADGSAQSLEWTNASEQKGRDGWSEFAWPLSGAGEIARRLTGVQLASNTGARSDAFIFISKPTLVGEGFADGYDLLTTAAPLMTAGMVAPLVSKPARSLPTRDAMSLGGYEIHEPGLRAAIPSLVSFIKKEFPQWDFILAPVWTPPLTVAEELPTLPEGAFFQFQKAQLVPDYLIASYRMPRNARGEALKEFGNAVLATDPVIQTALKDEVDYAASLGVNNFKQVDMVWPYEGGRWGYDKASVAAYRSALAESDEGLLLLPGLPGGGKMKKGGVIHFWDYYEYYHGFRLKPSELGLANWGSYEPVSEQQAANGDDVQKRNLGVYVMLYHYEWLRQGQRFGRWAKAHGGSHSFTLNPEDMGNGGDFVFLTFLADVGVPYVEYFGGPSVLRGAYHNLPFYVQAANLAGKKLGLTLEMGQGGHGQHYFDPEINYLYAYELAAAGLRNYHNEWIESDWQHMSDPKNQYQFDRWSSWMTGALGFSFAREQHVTRPETRVFNISVRSPGYYVGSWIWGLSQGPSFGPLLDENHVPYKQWDRSAMPEILNEADVIFYSPVSGRAVDWKLLSGWLKTPGKALVTHTNVPFSLDDGQALLAPGTESVNYIGIDRSYSDFLTAKTDFSSVVFSEFKSLRPLSGGRWSAIPGARIVLGDAQAPLLSSISTAGGGVIYYLHKDPLHLDTGERTTVAKALAVHLNLPRTVQSSSAPVMANRFKFGQTTVLNVWTGLDKAGFKGGYGPHLLPNRGENQFDRHSRPYPWQEKGREVSVDLPVDEEGSYRIYAFLSGVETLVEVGPEKTLRLTVSDALAEQFYYAKDGPSLRTQIETLTKHRERLLPYGPGMPR